MDSTWLFEKHHKSEQWWTTLFTLALVHMGANPASAELPSWVFRKEGRKWWYEPAPQPFRFDGLTLTEIHVEARLPNIFTQLKVGGPLDVAPDVIIKRDAKKAAAIIENKTQGAGVGRLDVYVQAKDKLRQIGYDASLYLLVSVGHPGNDIWKAVLQQGMPLLLWEDVLRRADSIGWFRD